MKVVFCEAKKEIGLFIFNRVWLVLKRYFKANDIMIMRTILDLKIFISSINSAKGKVLIVMRKEFASEFSKCSNWSASEKKWFQNYNVGIVGLDNDNVDLVVYNINIDKHVRCIRESLIENFMTVETGYKGKKEFDEGFEKDEQLYITKNRNFYL